MKLLSMNPVRRAGGLLLLSLSLPACLARAGSDTWVGGAPIFGSTTLWTAPGNWQSGSVPPSGSDLTFGTGFASGTDINLLNDQTVGTLTIDTSTPITFVNTGTTSKLSLLAGMTRTAASTGTQTIAVPVVLGSGGNWSINGTGSLVVKGPISNGTGTGLTVTGAGALNLGASGVNSSFYHLGVTSGNVELNGGQLSLTSTEILTSNVGLMVGSASTSASFTVVGGALLDMDASGAAIIDGEATVLGSLSTWNLPLYSAVGVNHTGHLTVSDEGIVAPKGSGSLLLVGLNQNAVLDVLGGGTLTSGIGALAISPQVSATANVSGAGTKWTVQSDLQLGGFFYKGTLNSGGTAMLQIDSNGQVSAPTTTFYSDASSIVINGGSLLTGALNGVGGSAGSIVLQADPQLGSALMLSNIDANTSAAYAGRITGAGTLVKDGAYHQSLSGQNDFGRMIVNGGTLTVDSQALLDSLTIAGTSKAPLAKLDLGSALVVIRKSVNGTATSTSNTAALTVVRDLIAAGYHNGAYDSNGIASSFDHGNAPFAVAYERQSDRKTDGLRIDPTLPMESIIIFNTFAGDANMDNSITFADLVAVAQNYGQSGKVWHDGDFNYDGVVSFADLVAVAQHYGQSLPSEPVPGASAEFDADMARAFAMVPEPTTVAPLAFVAMFFVRRRRD